MTIDEYQSQADNTNIPDYDPVCGRFEASRTPQLMKRYPEKFTEAAALNRDLVAEREVLEK